MEQSANATVKKTVQVSLRSRRIKGREDKENSGKHLGKGNACYKSRFFCISAYALSELSLQ